jgi:peptide/nickel transport system ATP-binding protein
LSGHNFRIIAISVSTEGEPLLSVRGLRTHLRTADGVVRAVDGVDFDIRRGETFGLVGESGCGKSMTALSILRLVPEPQATVSADMLRFDGRDLLSLDAAAMRAIRGDRIAMIFQEPMTSLNPVLTIGRQIAETLVAHRGLGQRQAARAAIDLLARVGIPSAAARAVDYPHRLSGGMRQRAMIAMAMACKPQLLIADEPTTALDVTIQAQILDLIQELKRDIGMAVLLITHNFGVIAETAERVGVMYAGRIVEQAPAATLFARPTHPYTRGLLRALPRLGAKPARGRARLNEIPGIVPRLNVERSGCAFAPRCPDRIERCRAAQPEVTRTDPAHRLRCFVHGNAA